VIRPDLKTMKQCKFSEENYFPKWAVILIFEMNLNIKHPFTEKLQHYVCYNYHSRPYYIMLSILPIHTSFF